MNSFLNDKAPAKGYILASYPDALVFEPYEIREGKLYFEGIEALSEEELRECHLFDDRAEYRMICRESAGDRIELLLSREEELDMDPDLVFEEEVLVRPQYAERGDLPEKLTIINRYRYSENDTLTLENYRISCNTEKINV